MDFMTDNTESLVTCSNEQNTKLDGSRWGRKGRGGDPCGTPFRGAIIWFFHELVSCPLKTVVCCFRMLTCPSLAPPVL